MSDLRFDETFPQAREQDGPKGVAGWLVTHGIAADRRRAELMLAIASLALLAAAYLVFASAREAAAPRSPLPYMPGTGIIDDAP